MTPSTLYRCEVCGAGAAVIVSSGTPVLVRSCDHPEEAQSPVLGG